MKVLKKYALPIAALIFFELIAIFVWRLHGHIFYLFNFSYIGSCLSLGLFLYIKKFKYARLVVQFSIGLYMFAYLGVMNHENMQIAGFWYYLFLGMFQAAVLHYTIAKIIGPLVIGRTWCGWACWTPMLLDFLPYKTPQMPRKKLTFIRYILFALSFVYVGCLFLFDVSNVANIMRWSFIIGNLLYYISGVLLAFAFKDNRAFCKYLCPITVFLKPASYFSLARVKINSQKCVSCGKCKKSCPMDVDMMNNSRKRLNGTECILCLNCVSECPTKALHL